MLQIMAVSAVGATRRALLAGMEQQLPKGLARSYSSVEGSFSIHVPKSNRSSIRRQGSNSKQRSVRPNHMTSKQRSSQTASTCFGQPGARRVIALRRPEVQQASTSNASDGPLHDLQKAIDGQDLASIWSAWQELGEHIRSLAIDEHYKLLGLCTSYAAGLSDRDQAKLRFGEIAQAASFTGDGDLICGWFRLLLANGQADDVIRIWQQLVNLRLANGPIPSKLHRASETEEAQEGKSERFMRIDESAQGERIDLHDLVCLVAFACTKTCRAMDFVDLFDRIEFGSPFRLFFNMSRAKRLFESMRISKGPSSDLVCNTDWSLVQSMLWRIELGRGLCSGSGGAQRIARLLGSLFSMGQVDEAQVIFETAMRALSQPRAWLSVERWDSSCTASAGKRVQWTESCWSVCLSEFIACGRMDVAMQVWRKFHELRLHPSARVWNALLNGYGRAKNYTAALQTWSAAIKQACTEQEAGWRACKLPDEIMYTTMIDNLFRANKMDEAMSLFSEMIAKSDRNAGKLEVRTETFNAVVFGLFINGKHHQARAVLDEMLTKGPAPNIGTINIFLRAYARIADWHLLAETLRLADKLKLRPDVVTFTTILDALLRSGGECARDAVCKTLGMMTSMRVQANVVTYTSMIKACLVGAQVAQLDMASQSMLGDSTSPTRPQEQVSIAAALDLLDRMIQAKIAPSEETYTALIGGCLQNPEAVAHALASKSIARHYCAPPKPLRRLKETKETVVQWMQQSPEVALALLLLEHMKARNLAAPPIALRHLIEALCNPRRDQAAFNRSMDLIDDILLGTQPPEPSRGMGPFASAVLQSKEVSTFSLHAPSHKTWIVVLSSLIDRLEKGWGDRAARVACGKALSLATRMVREMGSLSGAEGGLSLSRLYERAASLVSRVAR
ncbi:hypothetical protein NDA18_000433 [Ustilago nuda]|nr:hypothetical protein NDA18_000433 [Ustilago nuda]